jgi:RNA polymerase primary sigma factor
MKEKNVVIPVNQEDIKLYLKDIRKLTVLTPERERELSKMITSGNLTEKEKAKITDELIKGNLRFVISVAKQYQNQGLDLQDLISEGNLGLLKAIQNFDWSKNLRFISYAVWWIRQSIIQSLNENTRTIRLPSNIAQGLSKSKKDVDRKEYNDKIAILPSVVNLDNEINEEGDTMIDIIQSDSTDTPDQIFNTTDILKEKLMQILKKLDERERVIIEDYYGLSGNERTLEDIGEDFDLTKERVRQIKEKAVRRLRNECSSLFEYL